jgi:hypothetical protein
MSEAPARGRRTVHGAPPVAAAGSRCRGSTPLFVPPATLVAYLLLDTPRLKIRPRGCTRYTNLALFPSGDSHFPPTPTSSNATQNLIYVLIVTSVSHRLEGRFAAALIHTLVILAFTHLFVQLSNTCLTMKLYPSLSDSLAQWAMRQPVFFTGSAGTHSAHVNVSPKGLTDSHFSVLGPNRCAYIDRTGSGCETISHSYENGRLCLMFMSFGPTPRILRFFCRTRVVEWDQPGFEDLLRTVSGGKSPRDFDGVRAVIDCHIWEVQTSCGYGVPRVKKGIYAPHQDQEGPAPSVDSILREGRPTASDTSQSEKNTDELDELAVFENRPTLASWAAGQVEKNSMFDYQSTKNAYSIDGLPGLRSARRATGQSLILTDAKAWARRIAAEWQAVVTGFVLAIIMYTILRFAELMP